MPLPFKPSPATSLSLVGQIPPTPKIPASMSDRFPELAKWQADMDSWWSRFSDKLQRDIDQITTRFTTDEGSAATNLTTIQKQIADLQSAISALQSGGSGTIPGTILDQLQALTATVQAHITAKVVHGTISAVVGVNDTQDLDNKRIGVTAARYGRFWPAVQMQTIAAGTQVTVNAGECLMVAGPLDVNGQLTVAGTLLVL